MKIVKNNESGIKKAAMVLKSGGIVIYPTDTAYAIGGIYNDKKVIRQILQIKGRTDEKFTIICSSLSQVKKYFKFNVLKSKIATKYWPGPLSIVVSTKYAVRVPKNKTAQRLAKLTGRPLIATSANISGAKTIYSSQEIIKQFIKKKSHRDLMREKPDLMINAGKLPFNKTSTIVKITKKGVKLVRPGAVKILDY